ncbi:MAG: DUF1080 domain-containing protein [Planctomycetes bacterium]|nr:DUF1080 domain-containing protein [Planctomycetota bacterium]
MTRIVATLFFLVAAVAAQAQDNGFKPIFNGKDLTGWHNVNGAPSTWFVKDNMIITTGKPTGYLRTDKQYENFIAEFDWMHVPPKKGAVGNSGFFVWADPIPAVGTGYTRGIEVQVLVNLEWTDKKSGKSTATSHGDLFSIHGATCEPDRPHPLGWKRSIPIENRANGENEWNHYRVEANDGNIKLAVNGKFVSSVSKCNPRKGYLALEAEGSECRFKNLKIKELTTTNPKKEEICDLDNGWKSLFTGLDLSGWKTTDKINKHWKMSDGVLSYDGKGSDKDSLWSEKSYGDFELVCDAKPGGVIFVRGSRVTGFLAGRADKAWTRAALRVKGDSYRITINGKDVPLGVGMLEKEAAATGPIGLEGENATQFRNVFIRDLK